MSSIPGPMMELLGRVAYEIHKMKPLIPTYIHLLVSAIFPIYTAAHASLARPPSAAPPKRKADVEIADLQDEEISPTIEALTPSDAILFPVLAGITLASLYFILKWLQDPALLNYYLGLYFAVVGLFFQIKFVKDVLATIRSFFVPNQYSYGGHLWKLDQGERLYVARDALEIKKTRTSPLPGLFSIMFQQYNTSLWKLRELVYTRLRLRLNIKNFFNMTTTIDTLDIASLLIATPLVGYHTFVQKPWFLTNILGFSFCYGSLQITTPGTSWTGTLLLCALFFYDIYFVFFTPMMVTVATKLDVPIKLLFPRPDSCVKPVGAILGSKEMDEYLNCLAKKRTMAMLGLGDIVIPGMMLAFALRFDLYLYYKNLSIATGKAERPPYLPATGSWGERFWTTKKLHSTGLQAKQFPKTYFNASVIGYVVGMVSTVVAMQISQHAQPALLYLVPGVLISLWSTALVKGDFKTLWHYSEVPEDEKNTDKNALAKKEKTKSTDRDEESIKEIRDSDDEATRSPSLDLRETDKQSTSGTAATKDADPKPSLNNNVSSTSNKPQQSEEKHLVLFSLDIIPAKTLALAHPEIKHETGAQRIESSPESGETDSDSCDDWSSEAIGRQERLTTILENASKPMKKGTAPRSSSSIAIADGQPAVKRRRKA